MTLTEPAVTWLIFCPDGQAWTGPLTVRYRAGSISTRPQRLLACPPDARALTIWSERLMSLGVEPRSASAQPRSA